jgi:tetratricopeptide (TPR) repeat protein
LRTLLVAILFAGGETTAQQYYERALQYIEEAKTTRNIVRQMILGMRTIEALDDAVWRDPEHLDARFLLVRQTMNVPQLFGGSTAKARKHAREIASRDPALGHLAEGYIAYRLKEHDDAFRELGEAVRLVTSAEHRALGLRWLGWLAQETQRYDEAFTAFETLVEMHYLDGLYEIGRTAMFCRCRMEAGAAALQRYIDSATIPAAPSKRDAEKILRELRASARRQ